MNFDESINFSYHIKGKCLKQGQEQVSLRNLVKHFPSHFLITIYKSFVRPDDDDDQLVILFMTNQIMKVPSKKLKEFNTIILLQLLVLSKEHLRVNYITNEVLNLLNLDVDLGNYALFTKSIQLEYRNPCLILFLKPIKYTTPVHQNMLQHFTAGKMYTSMLFFHIQYQNGTNVIKQ